MDHKTVAACRVKQHMMELPPSYETCLPAHQPGNFASILGKIPKIFSELLFYLDQNGVIIDWFTGDLVDYYSASGEFLGQHIVEVLPSTASISFLAACTTPMQTGQVSPFEYDLNFGAELHWHSVNCVRGSDSNLVVNIRGITKQKK